VWGPIASFFITNKWDFLSMIPTIGKFWAFIAYFVMANGAVWVPYQVGKFVLGFVKSRQKKVIPTESAGKRPEIISIFSSQLDELAKGNNISGLGRRFLENIKAAPPFLGIQHYQPVISPGVEQTLTEYFLAQEFVKANGKFIRGGRNYQVKREDTWESIAKDIYGDAKFSNNIKDANREVYSVSAGMSIELPYVNISVSFGMSSGEIDKKYTIAQRKWIEPTLESLRKQFYLVDDEILPLVNWIYDAAQNAAAQHAVAADAKKRRS
jgi:hypothetical protein